MYLEEPFDKIKQKYLRESINIYYQKSSRINYMFLTQINEK